MNRPIDGRSPDGRLPAYVEVLLAAEREPPPPPRGAEDRVRARVAASVVVAGAVGMAGSAAAATAAGATVKAAGAGALGSALGVKTSLIVVAIAAGATATGGLVMHERRTHAPAQAAPVATPAQRRTPVAAAPEAPPIEAQAPPIEAQAPPIEPQAAPIDDSRDVPRAPLAPAARPDSRRRNVGPPPMAGLTEENVPIASALAALANGDRDRAIAALEQHARSFPTGQLEEEREALWIQALVAAGDGAQARARADRFRRRFPGSIQHDVVAAALATIP
jgi:hypothetical protein